MVKLVASDLDGTILLNGAQRVDSSLMETIGKLSDMGVIFAPASGRQIVSLKRLFEPVSDRLLYIAENGALVEYKGEVIAKTAMDRELALEIIEDVIKIPSCEVLVSGRNTAYIKPKSKEYYYRMTEVVNYHTTLVDNFDEINEDILKVAVCDLSGIDNSKEYLKNTWESRASAVVSGTLYLDFMADGVSKGRAMKQIQEHFRLEKEDCMAFGDNFNDCDMLDCVEYSYVMEKAVEEVKKHGKYVTSLVEGTLKKYFNI